MSIGVFWLIEIFIDEIRMDVNRLNELSENGTKNHMEMKQLFNKIIQDFSDVKQLSGIFFCDKTNVTMERMNFFFANFRMFGEFNGIFQTVAF